jgi:Domain of unknown function (DUF4139)/N-terminal domain of unknown function (DUF4140)
MKKPFLSILFVMIFCFSFAGNEKEIESKIVKVKVYLQGAMISRTADVNLEKGQQTLVFKSLTYDLDESSLQLKCDNPEVKILSVSTRKNFLENKKAKAEVEFLWQKSQTLKQGIIRLKKVISIRKEERALLMANKQLGGTQDGVQIEELKIAVEYYRQKLTEIEMSVLDLGFKADSLHIENSKIVAQMQELNQNDESPFTEVVVDVEADKAIKAAFELKYLSPQASWKAIYDVRASELDEPLKINCKALLLQNTNEDWEDVQLSLSTGNPINTETAPELKAWRLGFGRPAIRNSSYQQPTQKDGIGKGYGSLKGTVKDIETGEPIPYANIVLELGGVQIAGASTDFNGNYFIKPVSPGKYDLRCAFIGYRSELVQGVLIQNDLITFYDIKMKATNLILEEVNVVSYKVPLIDKYNVTSGGTVTAEEIARMPNRSADGFASTVGGVFSRDGSSGTYDYRRPISVNYKAGVKIPPTSSFKSIAEYEIALPYSIPSDNKEYTVQIKDVELNADYSYHSVPKISENAFLMAGILDWEGLDLIPGEANLYVNNSFIGSTYFDTHSLTDTINLSLGVDNNIVVQRERLNDFQENQFIGNNVFKKIGWKITVRNNKNKAVSIDVKDQIPVSTNKQIVVELLEASEADFNKEDGELKWKLKLEPQKSKDLIVKYKVKYPKYKQVILE